MKFAHNILEQRDLGSNFNVKKCEKTNLNDRYYFAYISLPFQISHKPVTMDKNFLKLLKFY